MVNSEIMAFATKEREEETRTQLPAVKLEVQELHSSLDVLSRIANNRTKPVSEFYSSVYAAEKAMNAQKGKDAYLGEGSAPVSARFAALIERIKE